MRSRVFRLAVGVAIFCGSGLAQLVIKNEDVQLKVGVLGQVWGSWTQDQSTPQGYQQNLFLRRIRLMFGGDLGKDVSFFLETDSPNLGRTPKAPASGLMMLDAFVEWKPSRAFRLDGGMFIAPVSRMGLQSMSTLYTLDQSTLTTVPNASVQATGMRDFGFQAVGYLVKDKLHYRLSAQQGQRDANAHNSLRTSGYVQYDFFEPETTYLFGGTALGRKKILAVDAGFDKQGAYYAYSANTALDLPVHHGDEIGGQFQFVRWDGRTKFLTIPKQNVYVLESAYYVRRAKAQPFFKWESQNFARPGDAGKDVSRVGGGVNYYIHAQMLKWTAQYCRALPANLKAANEFTMQLQFFYF